MKLRLIDSHCHPQFAQYDQDRNEVIARALEDGIGMIAVGTDLQTSWQAIELAETKEGVWATVGLHPNDASQTFSRSHDAFPAHSNVLENIRMSGFGGLIEELKKLAHNDKVVGIGETGLDFYRTPEKERQKLQFESFAAHILLANETKKPLVVHVRAAYQEAANFLKARKSESGGVIHCFAGSYKDAKLFLDLGFYISISGIVTFIKELQEVVRKLPLEKLLVETDAPYLAPVPHRGKRNEPLWVEFVARQVAEIKNLSFERVAEVTFRNTATLFNILV